VTAALLLALAQDPAYETLLLEAGERVDRVVAADLDGDGRPDLLVQSGVDLLFFPARGGRFEARPARRIRLEREVHLWTLTGTRPPRLLTSGSPGIREVPLSGGAAPRDLVVHPSIFRGDGGEAPWRLDFAPDLDRDGTPELFLYGEEELLVFKESPEGDYRCLDKVPVPLDSATLIPWAPHQKLVHTSSVPLLAVGDSNGDGRTDLGFYHEESLTYFLQQADGRFTDPESRQLALEKKKRRAGRLLQFDIPPKIGDFNMDGVLDLLIIYPSKGRVEIFYGRAGRTDYSKADEIMKVSDGWSSGVYLEDLDGDGRQDLVMGVIRKFGVSEGIQVFLSGKVDLELHVFPMKPNGRFTKDPVQELKFGIPFSFHLTRESASLDLVFRPNFKGDFNKDGLRDMLIRTEEKILKYYAGKKEGGFGAEAAGSVATSAPEGTSTTEPTVVDLNGDGVSDLVLKHVLVNPPRHLLELKLSR
jgi:hypothetical protein